LHKYQHFGKEQITFAGKHLLLDLWNIQDVPKESLIDIFTKCCEDAGATILNTITHDFGDKFGMTGLILLSESHLSWHSFPESHSIFIDFFTCGKVDPRNALPRILEEFKPTRIDDRFIFRGLVE
jgi:S-adenosylmethionine decarboxylase